MAGLYSFRFVVQEGFRFKTFEGTDVSLQYHINKSHAIRLGVTPRLSQRNYEIIQSNNNRVDTSENTEKVLGITALFLSQIKKGEISLLYWGVGPHVTRYDDQYNQTSVYNGVTSESSHSHPYWMVGVQLVLGCEVFIKKTISLVAEYGLSLMYNNQTSSQHNASYTVDEKGEYYTLLNQPLRIGISVYI